MRVLVMMSTNPRVFGGGVLRVMRTLRRIRSAFGLKYVYATPFAAPEPVRRSLTRILSPKLAKGFPARLAAFLRLCAGLMERFRPDIVYVVETDKFTLIAGYVALARGIPVIVEFTTTQVATNRLKSAMLRPILSGAQAIIAIHEDILASAVALGTDRTKIWLRDNPVDTSRFFAPPEAAAAPDRPVEHLMIGGFCDRKNQLFAIDVLASLPEHHRLTMVGPDVTPEDDGAYLAGVRTKVAKACLADRVRIIPGFTADVCPYLWAADVLWLPSKHEGLPNVVLEALCCGVPVVVNQTLHLGSHVRDGINGANAPLDVLGWGSAAVASAAIARHPGGRAAIADTARTRYDSRTIDRQQFDLFQNVASATNRRPFHVPMRTPE